MCQEIQPKCVGSVMLLLFAIDKKYSVINFKLVRIQHTSRTSCHKSWIFFDTMAAMVIAYCTAATP